MVPPANVIVFVNPNRQNRESSNQPKDMVPGNKTNRNLREHGSDLLAQLLHAGFFALGMAEQDQRFPSVLVHGIPYVFRRFPLRSLPGNNQVYVRLLEQRDGQSAAAS